MMLIAIVALAILVLVHEYGHFKASKWFGIPVPEFSIGFGPQILSWQRGGTVYSLRILLLGGYIRTDDCLAKRPVWQRITVAAAGPFVNLIFAFLAFTFVSINGVPQMTTKIGSAVPGYPAAAAHIQAGDRVISVDGAPVSMWADMIARIDQGRDRTVTIGVDTGQGKTRSITLTPQIKEGRGVIGVMAAGETISHGSGARAPLEGGRLVWNNVKSSATMFASLLSLDNFKKLGGPLYIAKVGAEQSRLGIIPLLFFMAIISANLTVLNLLPVPVLDGGLILIAVWEYAFKKPVNEKVSRVITGMCLGLMVSMALLTLINDLARILKPS